jgi:DNA-binding PadR family transcriptional regulator
MYVEILILASLHFKPRHGYEMKKYIEHLLGGYVPLNNTVLYPALKRFEEMGAVRREVERQIGKPDRHIYHLTEHGTETLQEYLCVFSPEMAKNEAEFLTRVGFFDLLEPEARIEILNMRGSIVKKKLEFLQELQNRRMDGTAFSNGPRVLRFQERATLHELEWIQQLLKESQEFLAAKKSERSTPHGDPGDLERSAHH